MPNFIGQRPVTFIATGSHANYIKSGTEDYTFAGDIVSDHADTGYYWDVTQNYRGYWYDNSTKAFSAATGDSVSWLNWGGYWGDQQYPSSYSGQYCIFGECHFTSGPTGPVAKNLGRVAMCENESNCAIFNDINDITTQF